MPTHAARFGPRIGGQRTKPVSTSPIPVIADLMATLFRVRVGSREANTSVTVLAFDAAQAATFARLRLQAAPDAPAECSALGYPAEHHDTLCGVLAVETEQESSDRLARYAAEGTA